MHLQNSHSWCSGEKNWNWQNGISENHNEYMKQYRKKNREKCHQQRAILYEKNKDYINMKRREKYKTKKIYNGEGIVKDNITSEKQAEANKKWRLNNPQKTRYYRKKYKAQRKDAGELDIKKIQMVYEDNIKKHGTLTCYLCNQLIPFGKDTLEHKIPVSRGGTNEYDNLSIACQHCNSRKHNKTVEEYMEELSK